jgi:anhydro-N-acetylmuramic acid kinase
MLLDALIRRLTNGEKTFDAGGEMAARGKVDQQRVVEWFQRGEPYFSQPPPKSTGREEFGEAFAEKIYQEVKGQLSPEDILATATEFTALTIHAGLIWLKSRKAVQTVIAGGGGVHNQTLMRKLAEAFAPARLTTCAEFGLPDDAKEAVAFAILGYETLHGRPSNVPSATRARGPAILGKLVLPPP